MDTNSTILNYDLAGAIKQARRFDLEALGQVFEVYYPQIFRYLAFRLGDGAETAGLCDQVFAGLLEALKWHPKGVDDIQSWLFSAAQNLAEEHLRGTAEGQNMIREDPTTDGRQPVGEAAWLGRLVRAALQRMVLDQQHLLALRFGCDFSLEDTARIMSRNVSEVKSLQMEALQTVRALMEEES